MINPNVLNSFNNVEIKNTVKDVILPIVSLMNGCKDYSTLSTCTQVIMDVVEEIGKNHPKDQADLTLLKSLQDKILAKLNPPTTRPPTKAPIGIRNSGQNCAFNSILQMLANAPTVKHLISQRSSSKLASTVSQALCSYSNSKTTLSEDVSQSFRSNTKDFANTTTQLDVTEPLYELFDQLQFSYHFQQETTQGNTYNTTSQREPAIPLQLSSKKSSLTDLFDEFLCTKTRSGTGERITTTKKFKENPEDLFFCAGRFEDVDGHMQKIEKDLLVPSTLTFTEAHTLSPIHPTYTLTGCIVHIGTLENGHYVSLEKRGNQWYLINDSLVSPLSNAEANKWIKKGYIFHYRSNDCLHNDHLYSQSQPTTSQTQKLVPVISTIFMLIAASLFSRWVF